MNLNDGGFSGRRSRSIQFPVLENRLVVRHLWFSASPSRQMDCNLEVLLESRGQEKAMTSQVRHFTPEMVTMNKQQQWSIYTESNRWSPHQNVLPSLFRDSRFSWVDVVPLPHLTFAVVLGVLLLVVVGAEDFLLFLLLIVRLLHRLASAMDRQNESASWVSRQAENKKERS